MKTFKTTMRVWHKGKSYLPGANIELDSDDETELKAQNAIEQSDDDSATAELLPYDASSEDQVAQLSAAVAELSSGAWRKDGLIRAGNLVDLSLRLGFEVTVEDVAAAKPAPENE